MKTDTTRGKKIAVVGGGVAGIAAAYMLQREHRITLFEKNDYVGGHTHTLEVPSGPDAGTPVDTGFIVFNNHTYPYFQKFLALLDVPYAESDMSFSYYNEETGDQYAGTGLRGLFAVRRNVFSRKHWQFLLGIIRFCRTTRDDLHAGNLAGHTLGDYCRKRGFHPAVLQRLVLPMGSAIWSTSMSDIREFPMEAFARFYENHGLLSIKNRPTWYYVCGGSQSYVRKFLKVFQGAVQTSSAVQRIARTATGVQVALKDGREDGFDACVIACHADEALALLADSTEDERRLLGAWKYSLNRTILHTDPCLMPTRRDAWASWNYLRERGSSETDAATLTYDMNRLQRLKTQAEYFVTLNPVRKLPPESVIADLEYHHPMFDFAAIRSQAELPSLNGVKNTYFCGSYFRNGFHEDAVWSAVCVGRNLGIEL